MRFGFLFFPLLSLLSSPPLLSETPAPTSGTQVQEEELTEGGPGGATPTGSQPGPTGLDGELAGLERLAEESFVQDDLPTAIALYRQLADRLETRQQKVKTLVTIAWLQHLSSLDRGALQTLTEAFVLEPEYPFRAELYSESFRDLFYEGQRQAIDERSHQAALKVRAGIDHLRQRDYPAARRELERALELRPGQPTALYNLALANLHDGKPDDALSGFQKLLALESSQPGTISPKIRSLALTNQGFLYNERGLYVEAEEALRQAVTADPQNLSAWSNLGVTRRNLGKQAEAAEAFRQAYQLAPDQPSVISHLATAYVDAEDWVSAVALLRDATARFSDDAGLWLNLGVAQIGLGNGSEAVASFQYAMAHDSQDSGGWASSAAVELAQHYYDTGAPQRSLEAADRAIGWKSGKVNAWLYRGLAKKALGDLPGAQESLERARTLDPARAEAHNNLGSVYYALGRRQEAIESFERALAIDPDLASARDNLVSIRQPGSRRLPPPQPAAAPPPPPPPPPPPVRPRLGVAFADIDYSALGLKGVMVNSVESGSAAELGGLAKDDLILRIDGTEVTSSESLRAYVASRALGSRIVLDLLRASRPHRLEIELR